MKYRQKSLIVEAIQIDGNEDELVDFMGGEENRNIYFSVTREGTNVLITDSTGTMHGVKGDWVIKGKERKLYIKRDADFKAMYEPDTVV